MAEEQIFEINNVVEFTTRIGKQKRTGKIIGFSKDYNGTSYAKIRWESGICYKQCKSLKIYTQ